MPKNSPILGIEGSDTIAVGNIDSVGIKKQMGRSHSTEVALQGRGPLGLTGGLLFADSVSLVIENKSRPGLLGLDKCCLRVVQRRPASEPGKGIVASPQHQQGGAENQQQQ